MHQQPPALSGQFAAPLQDPMEGQPLFVPPTAVATTVASEVPTVATVASVVGTGGQVVANNGGAG